MGLFIRGLDFPIRWLLSMSFTERSMSILSFIKLATKSSMISSLSSSNPWINTQFLFEYWSWSSLYFSKVSTLPFRVLTSSFKLFIISSFPFLLFWNHQICQTCVKLIPLVQQVVWFCFIAKVIYLSYFCF